MYIVCIAKKDLNLYQILSESETSRQILRFYHPAKTDFGVTLEVSTISNALSLLNEIRWYIIRYMTEILIEDTEHGVYLTRELAREAYETRSVVLTHEWDMEFSVCCLDDGTCIRVPEGIEKPVNTKKSFIVWGLDTQQP